MKKWMILALRYDDACTARGTCEKRKKDDQYLNPRHTCWAVDDAKTHNTADIAEFSRLLTCVVQFSRRTKDRQSAQTCQQS